MAFVCEDDFTLCMYFLGEVVCDWGETGSSQPVRLTSLQDVYRLVPAALIIQILSSRSDNMSERSKGSCHIAVTRCYFRKVEVSSGCKFYSRSKITSDTERRSSRVCEAILGRDKMRDFRLCILFSSLIRSGNARPSGSMTCRTWADKG